MNLSDSGNLEQPPHGDARGEREHDVQLGDVEAHEVERLRDDSVNHQSRNVPPRVSPMMLEVLSDDQCEQWEDESREPVQPFEVAVEENEMNVIGDHQEKREQFQELLDSRAEGRQAAGQVCGHALILNADRNQQSSLDQGTDNFAVTTSAQVELRLHKHFEVLFAKLQ
jgi:hypothetical protein